MRELRFPLRIVDGRRLAEPYRQALKPGALLVDEEGRGRRLPRFFYEVDSWLTAKELELAPNFELHEFIQTDVREAEVLRGFPRYVPCALVLLAGALSIFRDKVGAMVHVAANGGYRSPQHERSHAASTHCWGTAANVYQIGDELLDSPEKIEKFREIALLSLPYVNVHAYGHGPGFTDDHLHLDVGYVTVVPREAAGEEEWGAREDAI
ncbi:MAG TPA: hypothetical protein VGS57_22285 [Thermoanaerobaculia bacterium]|nr:hypothetical protein [Thermoanaerobaculia bacterium]